MTRDLGRIVLTSMFALRIEVIASLLNMASIETLCFLFPPFSKALMIFFLFSHQMFQSTAFILGHKTSP